MNMVGGACLCISLSFSLCGWLVVVVVGGGSVSAYLCVFMSMWVCLPVFQCVCVGGGGISVSVYLCLFCFVLLFVCFLRLVTPCRFCFLFPLCVLSSDLFVLLSSSFLWHWPCSVAYNDISTFFLLLISENADVANEERCPMVHERKGFLQLSECGLP